MGVTINLGWGEIKTRAQTVARQIREGCSSTRYLAIYGVPNGGIPAALAVGAEMPEICMVEQPEKAQVFVDDIVDSTTTRQHYLQKYNRPFYALVDKPEEGLLGQWVSFPWERMARGNDGIEDNVRRILQFIGEDPDREGLKETPARVARSCKDLYAGYLQKPEDVLKVFEDDSCDEMVIVRDVEFYSSCEHHMLPFFGRAHIAYIPDGRVIGVSKLVRILEVFSRRLQIQERLTEQVTASLMEHLKPKGAACVLEATHFCMTCRGVGKQNSKMITSSLTGVFRDKPEVRAEFFSMINR